MAKDTTTCWHTTSAENASIILQEGFAGGWGDVGFGVYLFDDVSSASKYADEGGWDGSLADPVIIEVQMPTNEIEAVRPHPDWPNPQDYEHVVWVAMDESTDTTRLTPIMSIL